MAAPTKPFNQNSGMPAQFIAPAGMSRLTVPSGGSLTVTFQSATAYVRLATNGPELRLAWTTDGRDADGYNSVGGGWPNPWTMPGQLTQLIITDDAGSGAVECDLAVVADNTLQASRVTADLSLVEGATEAHANA